MINYETTVSPKPETKQIPVYQRLHKQKLKVNPLNKKTTEELALEDCSFQPKTNQVKSYRAVGQIKDVLRDNYFAHLREIRGDGTNSPQRFEMLYKSQKVYKEKIERKKDIYLKKSEEELTFKPDIRTSN